MSYFKDDNGEMMVKLTIKQGDDERTPPHQTIVPLNYDSIQDYFYEVANTHGLDIGDMLNLFQIIAFFCEPERGAFLIEIRSLNTKTNIRFHNANRTTTAYLDVSVGMPITMGYIAGRATMIPIRTFEHMNDAQDAIEKFITA